MATLNLTFPAATPAPSFGYRVKYWLTSDPLNVTTATAATNSFSVVGLSGDSYSGTVEVNCGGGTYSSPRSFTTVV
jgi:hypothetical protein